MTKSHDPDKAIVCKPLAPFDHVIEHHRDLRNGTTDVHKAEKQKVEKDLAPRRHLEIVTGRWPL